MTEIKTAYAQLQAWQKATLRELEMVHRAINDVQAAPDGPTQDWIHKLEKWHEKLHKLVEGFPRKE